MEKVIRIGTRDSQLAIWQATQVKELLQQNNHPAELVPIRSEGDLDLTTPLYNMGVQGVFTRYLDAALLNHQVDVAVHSMKDVPTVLAKGITQAAVLKRGPVRDLLVYKDSIHFLDDSESDAVIATGSIRRIAQWLHRYPKHQLVNLRGNVNTRLRKLQENNWQGAIFAAAGLERINLRPEKSIELDWMLPAPAQGAIMVTSRIDDEEIKQICTQFNDEATSICTRVERDFLAALLGGCSTPISAFARIAGDDLLFEGNILTVDGKEITEINKKVKIAAAERLGQVAARELLDSGGDAILKTLTSRA